MDQGSWVRGPIGLDSDRWVTRTGCRMVLALVPTLTAGTRLLDVIPLLEADHRVQVVFTVPHAGETWHGTEEFVRRCGAMVLPWHQAVRHRWDLVLAASHRHIEQVHGPILIMPHGAGALKSRRYSRKAGAAVRATTGLDRDLLTYRGRLVPAAIALTHDFELTMLRRTCPEALCAAIVAGDLCLDRMVASQPFRRLYRHALGVADNEELVTISSTWAPDSMFGRHPDLYDRLLDEARSTSVRVAAVLHPNVWAVHGAWQVHAWLAGATRNGLILIPPHEGWHATMIASDRVLGDHGSTTSYAAAIGRPVHLVTPGLDLHRGSIADELARIAPHLDSTRPVLPQLWAAPDPAAARMAGLISSRPGRAAQILRAAMYRLLEIPEPAWPAPVTAVPVPQLAMR
jgi:hypothetical protein